MVKTELIYMKLQKGQAKNWLCCAQFWARSPPWLLFVVYKLVTSKLLTWNFREDPLSHTRMPPPMITVRKKPGQRAKSFRFLSQHGHSGWAYFYGSQLTDQRLETNILKLKISRAGGGTLRGVDETSKRGEETNTGSCDLLSLFFPHGQSNSWIIHAFWGQSHDVRAEFQYSQQSAGQLWTLWSQRILHAFRSYKMENSNEQLNRFAGNMQRFERVERKRATGNWANEAVKLL